MSSHNTCSLTDLVNVGLPLYSVDNRELIGLVHLNSYDGIELIFSTESQNCSFINSFSGKI